jgi:hypothetical protein
MNFVSLEQTSIFPIHFQLLQLNICHSSAVDKHHLLEMIGEKSSEAPENRSRKLMFIQEGQNSSKVAYLYEILQSSRMNEHHSRWMIDIVR